MLKFCLKRILLGFVIVILAVSSLYILVQMPPGDPIALMLGPRATPEMIARHHARLGLDQPMPIQVFNFLLGVFQGELGFDIKTKRDVTTAVLEQLPNTVSLILASLALAAGLGIPLGCYSALHKNT